jgi:hypothetical protein
MPVNKESQAMSRQEAESVLYLTSLPQWQELQAYLERRRNWHGLHLDNQSPDKPGEIGKLQGRRLEINDFMRLRQTAEELK